MNQGYYRYGNVKIWGDSTYEKYGVMKLLQSIDAENISNTDVSSSSIVRGAKHIHIYCLSDIPLLGMAKRIDEIRKKHNNENKIIILIPTSVPRTSFFYINNVSVIPHARTILRMSLLLKAALYTDRYVLIKKSLLNWHRGKYIFYQSLRSKDISEIAVGLKISPKTAYTHRTNYTQKMLGFKHRQIAKLFFIGCSDMFN